MIDFREIMQEMAGKAPGARKGRILQRVVLGMLVVSLALTAGTGCRKKTPDERLQEIQDLFRDQKIVNAVLKSKELIRDFPDDPAAYEARAALAFYYFQTGDPERAHEYLEQIYRGLGLLDYRGFGAVLQDAEIYQMQEDYETALSTLDWALETVPHDAETTPELLMAKASLLVKSDNTTEGIRLYREMMLKAPQPQVRGGARERLAQFYRRRNEYQKEIDVYNDYEQAFDEPTIKPQFDIIRGLALKNLGKTEEGQALFDEGIETLKKDAQGELEQNKAIGNWMAVAQYYLVADMPEEAAETLKTIREEYPQNPASVEAGVALGDIYVSLDRFDDALAVYNKVREENPLGPVAGQMLQRIRQAEATTGTLSMESGGTTGTTEEMPRETEPPPPPGESSE